MDNKAYMSKVEFNSLSDELNTNEIDFTQRLLDKLPTDVIEVWKQDDFISKKMSKYFHQNKEKAMEILRGKLAQMALEQNIKEL